MPIYTIPLPKQGQPPRVPIVSQEDTPSSTTLSNAKPLRRSKCINNSAPTFQALHRPMNVSQEALYTVLARGMEAADWAIPTRMEKQELTFDANFDLQEFCGGVVHPITKETITSYKKLVNNPHLKQVWTKAMCKELGNIAQGYGDQKGTNTVQFLTHADIAHVPRR